MDQECYVSYEIAKRLKACGFDESCYFYYTKRNAPDGNVWCTLSEDAPVDYNKTEYAECSAPTLFQAQNWLRKKHKIIVDARCVYTELGVEWVAHWWDSDIKIYETTTISFASYEEALADGILTVLDMTLKEKKTKSI